MGKFITNPMRNYLKVIAQVSSMGLAMVIATIIGLYLGYSLDKQWIIFSPWGKIGGLVLGVAAGYRNIYVIWKRNNL